MSRFSFSNDDSDEPVSTMLGRSESILLLIVRGFGLVLMLVGFVIALQVIGEAWSLYEDPKAVETLARRIELDSGLDAALAPLRPVVAEADAMNAAATSDARPPAFRLSYFVAWAIALLLLLLVGRLAIAAVKTGGELALYDLQLRHLTRALLKRGQADAS